MRILDLIEVKKRGGELSAADIVTFVDRYVAGELPDYQVAALLMAIRWRGLSEAETIALTHAMVASGDRFDMSGFDRPLVDKHSTGGIGDKISLALAPLLAACGYGVPMVSGRGLGHTGGTLDKLESIPGFRTDLSADQFRRQMDRIGVAMGAQTEAFVPADRLLYALRDATATVDDSGLITASILSKKLAEGCAALALDVKVGSGGFCPDIETGRQLARRLVEVARGAGLICSAVLTRMDRPLGRTVGNALEVLEALDVLRGQGPADIRELVLTLSAEAVSLVAPEDAAGARRRLERALDDGSALERFAQIVECQGGNRAIVEDRSLLPQAASRRDLPAPSSGTVLEICARDVGDAATALRAGRDRKEDRLDPGAGLEFQVAVGDRLFEGDPWVTLHHGPEADLGRATDILDRALRLGDALPEPTPLILETLR